MGRFVMRRVLHLPGSHVQHDGENRDKGLNHYAALQGSSLFEKGHESFEEVEGRIWRGALGLLEEETRRLNIKRKGSGISAIHFRDRHVSSGDEIGNGRAEIPQVNRRPDRPCMS